MQTWERDNIDITSLRLLNRNLQQAILVCSERCLYNATKWASEILDGIHPKALQENVLYTNIDDNLPCLSLSRTHYESSLPALTEKEQNRYLYAKALFQVRQYDNASFVLKEYNAPRLRFLRLYAKYLAGEQRKEERTQDILGAHEHDLAENTELMSIYQELHNATDRDAFCDYLYGVVLRKREEIQEAFAALLRSVKSYEYNWSAWVELGMMITTKQRFYEVKSLLDAEMPGSVMKDFFLMHVILELHTGDDDFWIYMNALSPMFPNSTYLKSQKANMLNEIMENTKAETLFQELHTENPYRLEDMDVYSNLLYLQDSREKLAVLAHQCVQVEKYRPETCVVIANYYSIKREFAHAIEYFKRALKLNRSYYLAWTLLGHDYIELKDTNSAIECYRRAINANPRDYRAWYGLGQAYEILTLYHYATFYYKKALEIRPEDARMWSALGDCYGQLDDTQHMADCHQRSTELEGNNKQSVMIRLARTFERQSLKSMAAKYYKAALEEPDFQGSADDQKAKEQDRLEACMYLARHYISQHDLDDAERLKLAEEYIRKAFPDGQYNNDAKQIMAMIKAGRKSSARRRG
ncbi:anaphase promoting complex subunit 8 [Syncephalastrum racemosum]|uniref:Anaphase promoting complex subunit 8 n=1 Tax=Syncephalastrum racemosum TaxID=13706 RepID=A0A1X2HI72_SYNRA|nr:anaphase promoting complex subunit 8 [Syncephalastrum racemosum]